MCVIHHSHTHILNCINARDATHIKQETSLTPHYAFTSTAAPPNIAPSTITPVCIAAPFTVLNVTTLEVRVDPLLVIVVRLVVGLNVCPFDVVDSLDVELDVDLDVPPPPPP